MSRFFVSVFSQTSHLPARPSYLYCRNLEKMMAAESRVAHSHVDPVFVERWSPRSFDPSYQLSQEDIEKIFEAARWAPSSFNEQPWSFRLASHQSPAFSHFLAILYEGNRVWAKNASALVFIIGRRFFLLNHEENTTFEFDCGAAWMSLTMQARFMGLYTHGMVGFDRHAAEKLFQVDPQEHKVIAAFAIGRRDEPEKLPPKLREREHMNDRKELYEILEVYETASITSIN